MTTNNAHKAILFTGKYLRLMKSANWEYVQRTNVSSVILLLAITGEGKIILTEQYRPPLEKRVIELPAGLVGDIPEDRDETLISAARRELLEETGYEAAEITFLVAGPSSAGLTSEIVTLVRAAGLRRVAQGGGEGNENIQVHEIALNGLVQWLAQKSTEGILIDPKVYAALYFATSTYKI